MCEVNYDYGWFIFVEVCLIEIFDGRVLFFLFFIGNYYYGLNL